MATYSPDQQWVRPEGSSGDPGSTVSNPDNTCPSISVQALLGTHREVVLIHNGEPYRLRITAKNRLILTK